MQTRTVSNEIYKYADVAANKFEIINQRYLELVAEHIKEIGTLEPDDLHMLNQFAKMQANIEEINKLLVKQTKKTYSELMQLYKKAGLEEYEYASVYFKHNKIKQTPFEENEPLQNHLKAIQAQTKSTFINLSNTTLSSLNYQSLIDEAVIAVSQGLTNSQTAARVAYNQAMEKSLVKKARNGIYVQYNSGATRRLDSVIRMNIRDGFKQLMNKTRQEIGKQFGADGVEIDAHGMCAEDHQPYQGKQYSLKKYNSLDMGREISTCNCRHSLWYIILGVNKPTYSKDYLNKLKELSNEKIEINGRELSRYNWSQVMRNLETEMRKLQDEINTLKVFGANDLENYYNKLQMLDNKYIEISKLANIEQQRERIEVF